MKNLILLFTVLSVLNISCELNSSGQYTYQTPESINDGLEVGTLNDANINAEQLAKEVIRI